MYRNKDSLTEGFFKYIFSLLGPYLDFERRVRQELLHHAEG